VVGTDQILQDGTPSGTDIEVCTVGFGLRVLCDDVVTLQGEGNLHASWSYVWPTNSTTGPASFDGTIDGGTLHYAGASGTFHAVSQTDHDLVLTASITLPR
jgi:hypothetical protein